MSNFKSDIIDTVGEDTIEAVVILSNIYEGWGGLPDPRNISTTLLLDKIISYELALYVLDYKYDSGFGGMDCHDIYLYSADWVYYIQEYDGATSIDRLPRNPTGV